MGDWGKTGITYILLSFQSISGSGEQNQRAVVVHHENGNLDGNRSNQPKYKAWLKDPLDGENVSDKLEGRLFGTFLLDQLSSLALPNLVGRVFSDNIANPRLFAFG